jgi:hypothetical protein
MLYPSQRQVNAGRPLTLEFPANFQPTPQPTIWYVLYDLRCVWAVPVCLVGSCNAYARSAVTAEVASSSLVAPPIPRQRSWRFQGDGAALSPRIISSARPWVDYRNRKILKMRCVSCCLLRMRSKHDAGNHCVAQFTWTFPLMTHSHQVPSLLRRGCTKRSDSTLDLLNKDSLECLKQGRASLPTRQNLQSVMNLEDGYGGCPNGYARLLAEPFDNTPVGWVPHERRENVGIENDHRSKRAGLVWYPRSSVMSSSSPTLANSEAISVPRPPAAASCSFTAFRSISRTSSPSSPPFIHQRVALIPFFPAFRPLLCDSRHAVVCPRVKRRFTRRLTNAAACIFARPIIGLNYLAGAASKGRTSRSTLSAISSSATYRSLRVWRFIQKVGLLWSSALNEGPCQH